MYVPNTFALARNGRVLVSSRSRKGMIDQPDLAIEILRSVSVHTNTRVWFAAFFLHLIRYDHSGCADEQGSWTATLAVVAKRPLPEEQVLSHSSHQINLDRSTGG